MSNALNMSLQLLWVTSSIIVPIVIYLYVGRFVFRFIHRSGYGLDTDYDDTESRMMGSFLILTWPIGLVGTLVAKYLVPKTND